jgi:hypothetical protein
MARSGDPKTQVRFMSRYLVTIVRQLTLRADVDVAAASEEEAKSLALAFAKELPDEAWEKDESGTPWAESVRDADI